MEKLRDPLILATGKTYSTMEAAKLLGFRSPTSIRSAANSHQIPGAFKRGSKWRIPAEYIFKRLETEAQQNPAKNRIGRKRGQARTARPT